MGHIFISYSHKDSSYVHKLVRALEEEGFEVWIDDRIHYGSEWPKVVTRNLDASDGVIIVMSNNSFESDMVQNEITRAREEKKPIFPLLLDGKNWLIVQAKQFVDVKDGSLPTEKFYKRLEEITPRKNEKAEREAAEKAEREKAERNASEKAAREKEKRDAAEAKRERAERQTVRKAVLVKASSNFLITLKSTLSKAKPVLRVIGIIGISIVLFWASSWGLSKLSLLFPTAQPTFTSSPRPTLMVLTDSVVHPTKNLRVFITDTDFPTPSSTNRPNFTFTPTATFTPTLSPTATVLYSYCTFVNRKYKYECTCTLTKCKCKITEIEPGINYGISWYVDDFTREQINSLAGESITRASNGVCK